MEIVAPKKTQGKRWNLLKTGDNGGRQRKGKINKEKIFYKIFYYAIPIIIYLFMTKVPRIE